MQQILNSKERNEAFLKFLAFFVITILLVVLAIYFDFKLPIAENKSLREKISLQFQQENDQQKFVGRMNEAIKLLDSMDNSSASALESINAQLIGKINNEMRSLPESSNPIYRTMNKAITDKLDELRNKKIKLKDLSESQVTIDKLQNQLNDCNQRLQTATMTIQGYQTSRGGGN